MIEKPGMIVDGFIDFVIKILIFGGQRSYCYILVMRFVGASLHCGHGLDSNFLELF
jgi:hypothetical protein